MTASENDSCISMFGLKFSGRFLYSDARCLKSAYVIEKYRSATNFMRPGDLGQIFCANARKYAPVAQGRSLE